MEYKISVLLTCHNRRETTVACLRALFENRLDGDVSLAVVLVDDGSTDGTQELVRDKFPQVKILQGDGNLFWNRGMHKAFEYALACRQFDAYLWLNDDTILRPHAISTLVNVARQYHNQAMVVGAVCDPTTGQVTYGGGRRVNSRFRPFYYDQVAPTGRPEEVDVVNGNVLLVPDVVARRVGNLDPVYEHGMGDTDYSLRAGELGVKIFLTPAFVGSCSRNSNKGTFRDRTLPFSERISNAFSRKGLPLRSWFSMCSRHGGPLWPIHFFWGYLRILLGKA